MARRKLGADGPPVGAIGLGCMSFAGFYGPATEEESHRTLKRALDLGITHLDTARVYGDGLSEEIIGRFIRGNPGAFVIATKGGIRTAPVRSFDNSAGFLRECVEGSLKRLGIDHIPLYYIHRRDSSVPIEDVMGTLLRFKDEGEIGAIGFSEIAPASLERAQAIHPVAAVQSEYSLWSRLPELGMLQACKRTGTAFVAFSPLARAMFGATDPDPAAFGDRDIRRTNPRFTGENFARNLAYMKRFRSFAGARGYAPASLALAWLLKRGSHIHPIPGTRSVAHLEEHAAAAFIRLSAADMAEIEAVLPAGFAHGDRYSDQQMAGVERYS
jgi:aryl-alcohol dehydrogenase-like predicted oxidoreductase